MRRVLSIFLVLFFGFGPLAVTLEASDDARLPACCRRNGEHHCAMSNALRAWMLRSESRTPGFTAPSHCPLYPTASPAATTPVHALTATAVTQSARLFAALASVSYRASIRPAALKSIAVRGPPAFALA